MTRGRKLSVSSICEKVEKVFGKEDDNPYDLPPIAKDPESEKKLFGIQDPSRIPVIGKLLRKPKPKAVVARRRRSSSLPARYLAIYAETPPEIEVRPEHFIAFDEKEKAYYDFFPELRPCMTVEEFNEEFAKWDTKCNVRHLKKHPPKIYARERKFASRELLNPRPAPKPPGFVERPQSKQLPPIPPQSDDRSTRDTDYLISQFPPPPDAIPAPGESNATNPRRPVQRRRSGSEGTKPPGEAAVDWCLGLKFAPDIRSKLCYGDGTSFAADLSRPTIVYYLKDHEVPPLPAHLRGGSTTRSRQASITAAQTTNPPTGYMSPFRASDFDPSDTVPPTGVGSTLTRVAQLTEEEVARAAARAEALRKLEQNQSQVSSPPSQAQGAYCEPAKVEEAKYNEERERKNEKERQRQRLKSEPKARHGPSSSGAQEKHRERQPHEENRQHRVERPQVEGATHTREDERDRREHKSEKEHHRERNKSEPKRRRAPSSSAVAPEKQRERQPEDTTRARVGSRAQDDTRRRNVRRSVSASGLYDMVQSQVVNVPPRKVGPPTRHVHAGAPLTTPPAHPLPSLPITPITPSNIGVRVPAGASSFVAPDPAQGHAPTAIRPRPSRPNLGPPPSLSAGTAHRNRAPSITTRSGWAEEKPPLLKERLENGVLHRKASNSSMDGYSLDKNTISGPVKYIKGAETGLLQLRHAQLHVQDLQVTMIPLPYYVQYPPTPESIAPKAGAKAQTSSASSTGASSQATTPGAQSDSTSPALVQTAQRTAYAIHHTANGSASSASSYGSSSSNTHGYTSSSNHGGYASSTTSQTHYGYVRRTYEECISPAPARIIAPSGLKTNNPPLISAEPRAKKTSLTPMHVHLPKNGTITGGSRPPQVNAVASSSRDVIDNIQKGRPVPSVDPEFEDEELIRGYKPRKFVDIQKLKREYEDVVHRERKELPAIPFPAVATPPLRIRKKASVL